MKIICQLLVFSLNVEMSASTELNVAKKNLEEALGERMKMLAIVLYDTLYCIVVILTFVPIHACLSLAIYNT